MAKSITSTPTEQSESPSSKVQEVVASVKLPETTDAPPIESVTDAATEKMRADVVRQVIKAKLKREVQDELDPDADQTLNQQVHRSVPKMMFLIGSRAIHCPKFALDDEESDIFADALSTLMPKMDSKIYAIIVMVFMTGEKLLVCEDAIRERLKGLPFKRKVRNVKFDKKEQKVVEK